MAISDNEDEKAAPDDAQLVEKSAPDEPNDESATGGLFAHENEEDDESNTKALDKDFVRSLQILRTQFTGREGKSKAIKALYPLIERSTVERFFTNIDKKDYNAIQKRRLIWYFDNGPEMFVYRRIAERLSSDHNQKKILINKYQGGYTYFRYFAPTTSHRGLNYVSGQIKIYEDHRLPKFDHWSHNYDSNASAEHSGYLFQCGSNLFFAATGNNIDVLRLAICGVPKKKTNWMTGLVLSVRSEEPHDPFAARFLMVNNDNSQLISDLKNDNIDPNSHGGTLGERLFFDMTQGGYAYYMLAKHLDQKK